MLAGSAGPEPAVGDLQVDAESGGVVAVDAARPGPAAALPWLHRPRLPARRQPHQSGTSSLIEKNQQRSFQNSKNYVLTRIKTGVFDNAAQ